MASNEGLLLAYLSTIKGIIYFPTKALNFLDCGQEKEIGARQVELSRRTAINYPKHSEKVYLCRKHPPHPGEGIYLFSNWRN